MDRTGNVIFVLTGASLVIYGIFTKSWYSIVGGFGFMVFAGFDSGEKK